MRLRSRFLMLWVVLLALVVVTTGAAPYPNTLTSLAAFMPHDTPIYLAARADDDFIAQIDRLSAQLADQLRGPSGIITAPVSTRQQDTDPAYTPLSAWLDTLAQDTFGGSFDETTRPWLGDSLALGVTDVNTVMAMSDYSDAQIDDALRTTFPIVMAAEVVDVDMARATIEGSIGEDVNIIDGGGGYVLYHMPDTVLGLLLRPDALIISDLSVLLDAIDRPAPTLADSPDFRQVMEALPAEAYAAWLYISYEGVAELSRGATALDPTLSETAFESAFLDIMATDSGGIALGAANLDGETYALDIVQTQDAGLYEDALEMTIAYPFRTQPELAQYLPADTALLIFQDDLRTLYEASVANTRALLDMQAADDPNMLTGGELDMALLIARVWMQANLGLGLESEILSWMQDGYVLAIAPSPELATLQRWEQLSGSPVDFLVLFEVDSNPEIAERALGKIVALMDEQLETRAADIEAMGFTVTRGTYAHEGQRLPLYRARDNYGEIPFSVEVVLGSNADVLAIGTPRMVATALDGDGTLLDSTLFAATQGDLVDDVGLIMLASGEGLAPFSRLYELWSQPNPYATSEGDYLRKLAAFFPRATISGSNTEDGMNTIRLTLTLALE